MNHPEIDTQRTEAFSDGVFAIAITLLILEVKVPHSGDGPLVPRLLALWPSLFAYLTSFATIGIMWLNHHHLFTLLRRVDHGTLLWNLGLLLGISFIPFPTAVLAEHLRGQDARAAAMFFSGSYVVMAALFNGFWRHVSSPRRQPAVLRHAHDAPEIRAVRDAYRLGPVIYFIAFVLGAFSPVASLALNLALACFFALPIRPKLAEPARA